MEWAAPETHDTIFEGREFLRKLLDQNCVLAPSALVRRRCYETISMFPLDLPIRCRLVPMVRICPSL